MDIAELDESHVESLVELIKSIYCEDRRYMLFAGEPSSDYLEKMLRFKIKLSREGKVVDIVAMQNGSIVGECEIVKDGGIQSRIGIFVKKENRKNGVGKMLLSSALNMARAISIKSVLAEIDASNHNAVRFFGKNGFSAVKGSDSGTRTSTLEIRL